MTYRNVNLRRAVAELPCVRCGVHGYTQAAHGGSSFGKGGALKASDAALMALCGPRLGINGCHADFDSGGIYTREEKAAMENEFIAKTLIALIERGRLVVSRKVPLSVEESFL